MKALKRPATDEEMLSEFPRRARTPDWFIKVEEFANGGWRVKARDRWGRGIEQTGGDSDVPRMIEEAERYAASVAAQEITEPVTSIDERVATLLSEMTALVDRLRNEAQPSWSEWVEADRLRIAAGDGRGLDHFLSAFGGMGSLNDVEMDAQTRELCSRCWTLARELQRDVRG
jgi:hypothetical protein